MENKKYSGVIHCYPVSYVRVHLLIAIKHVCVCKQSIYNVICKCVEGFRLVLRSKREIRICLNTTNLANLETP